MDKLNQKIIDHLNLCYGRGFFAFSEKGLTIKLTKELKRFFSEYRINSEMDFDEHWADFRDDILGSGDMSFCMDNDRLYPNHFGMTNAPLFGFGGELGVEEMPVEYAFMYFNSYQVLDWLKELKKHGEVTFETFIDNSEEYENALRRCDEVYL